MCYVFFFFVVRGIVKNFLNYLNMSLSSTALDHNKCGNMVVQWVALLPHIGYLGSILNSTTRVLSVWRPYSLPVIVWVSLHVTSGDARLHVCVLMCMSLCLRPAQDVSLPFNQ